MLASQQVIAAIVARLVAAATSAGARVYSDRFHPVDQFPTLKVRHLDEDLQATDDDVTYPAVQQHQLQVEVTALQRATTGLDDALAALAQQVLQALQGSLAAATLAPLAGVSLQANSISYQAATDGEAAIGIATVRLTALFHTAANDPTTLI